MKHYYVRVPQQPTRQRSLAEQAILLAAFLLSVGFIGVCFAAWLS